MRDEDHTRIPRIPLNDYGVLGDPPELGAWTPSLAVSVIVPAYRAERTLPLTLAALAAQTYPSHLLEVVVVDDGDHPMPPLDGPMPARTRIVRPAPGVWGKPAACVAGAEIADGDVIHFLDADVVPFPDHVEAHMRWHHLASYLVVLGRLRFVPGLDEVPANEVLAAIEAGALDKLFPDADGTPQWTEERWDQTADLREAGLKAFSVMVGATASLPAALFRAAGGLDRTLVLGEDTELGYRLAQAGAVFVADRAARARHIGESTVMRREQEVKRHNWPYLAERVPAFRWLRRHPARRYLVPYVEVVVAAGDASFEEVRGTVDAVLASRLPDVSVRIVAPWSRLRGGRRDALRDPDLDLRLVRACYEGESRVAFCESVPDVCFPVPFRLHCPPGWAPGRSAIGSLVKFADRRGLAVVSLALEEGADGEVVHARLERTAAFTRARWCAAPGDDLDDLAHEMFGTLWDAGDKWGIAAAQPPPPPPAARPWSADPGAAEPGAAAPAGDSAAHRSRRTARPLRRTARRTARRIRRRLRSLVRAA
ncbi:glycosyltransferase [Microbispora sp. RL4-1S]|uniref:Glycosyltransferase n=1 Tax=Microbispora oryzae TaxID=2806554 RepID=A0A941AI58_9ACTN|nr:glycosyltransferase family 2 protein [Microbispora oryzae]MBP2704801.1 glycosyltransferase [Microbispora oryzae]